MAKRANADGPVKGATLNLRIRPKIKYGLELLARRQHRSVAAAVETMAQKAVYAEFNEIPEDIYIPESISHKVDQLFDLLWAPTEAGRLARLHEYAPDLMTYDDDRRWEVICGIKLFWGVYLFERVPPEELIEVPLAGGGFGVDLPMDAGWIKGEPWRLIFAPDSKQGWFGVGKLNFLDKTHARRHVLSTHRVEDVWTELVKVANDESTVDELQRIVDERQYPTIGVPLDISSDI